MMPREPSTWVLVGLAALGVAGLVVAGGAPIPQAPQSALVASSDTVDRELTVEIQAIECPEGYDNQADDDVCLGYDGQIPGPTFVFEEGQDVQFTVEHNVTATIANLEAPEEVAEELSQARYTLHRHGVSVTNCNDGVARPIGTQICDSTVGPNGSRDANGSITYNFTTEFPGFWHYHDHALGLGVGTQEGDEAGMMAEHRGLWGAFRVVPEGSSTENVFDLHLLDTGANGGLGLDETVQAGERFALIATGLGDNPWTVTLEDPDGETVWTKRLGPGVSRGYTVDSANQGTYEWTAQSPLVREDFTGEVVAE